MPIYSPQVTSGSQRRPNKRLAKFIGMSPASQLLISQSYLLRQTRLKSFAWKVSLSFSLLWPRVCQLWSWPLCATLQIETGASRLLSLNRCFAGNLPPPFAKTLAVFCLVTVPDADEREMLMRVSLAVGPLTLD